MKRRHFAQLTFAALLTSAIAPRKASAQTSPGFYMLCDRGQVYRSTNGQRWTPGNYPDYASYGVEGAIGVLPNTVVEGLAVAGRTVVVTSAYSAVAEQSGRPYLAIARSADGGSNWRFVEHEDSQPVDAYSGLIAGCYSNGRFLFGGGFGRIYASDNGSNWSLIRGYGINESADDPYLSINDLKANGSVVVAAYSASNRSNSGGAIANGTASPAILMSSDGGQSWRSAQDSRQGVIGVGGQVKYSRVGRSPNAYAAIGSYLATKDPNGWATETVAPLISVSSDLSNWRQIDFTQYSPAFLTDIAGSSAGFIATAEGNQLFYGSANGGQWEAIASPFSGSDSITAVGCNPTSNLFCIGNAAGQVATGRLRAGGTINWSLADGSFRNPVRIVGQS